MKRKASADVRRAAKLFAEFREEPPRRARAVKIKLPKALAVMGYLSAVEYETTHRDDKGKRRRAQGYRHTFAPGSRPMICAAPGVNGLFIVGGHYHVTERGIVDLDPTGKEIED